MLTRCRIVILFCIVALIFASARAPAVDLRAEPSILGQVRDGDGYFPGSTEVPANPPQIAPIQSVCTACHDGGDAVAHAETNTAADGIEACPVCHQEGAAFAVSGLHAGRN